MIKNSYLKRATLVILSLSLSFLCALPLQAQEMAGFFIDAIFATDETPQDVYFLIYEKDRKLSKVRGIVVPILQGELQQEKKQWRAGARVECPVGATNVRYSVLIATDLQAFHHVPDAERPCNGGKGQLGSPEALRAELSNRKELLKSWQMQLQIQEDSLSRLRADAEVIGNLSRIVEVQEEIARTVKNVADIDRDMENLRFLLQQARSGPLPPNYLGREAQLTRQVAELAEAARKAEAHEVSRSSLNQQELQRKLALVESTRNENYDALQRELIRLRGKRMQLESISSSR